jgi:hypothetical protein
MLAPDLIVVHHSATPDGRTFSWHAIQHYHTKVRGWDDIGYHAGIELIGDKYLCLFGRPDVVVGAHTYGFNQNSLGFCFVGNFDDAAPCESRLRTAARRVLVPWAVRYDIPLMRIKAHRDFSDKTCPGLMFHMDVLRDICEEELHALRK